MEYYDTHVPNPLVKQNAFIGKTPEDRDPPSFADARPMLPEPLWESHDAHIACYWKAWKLAFRNLRRPAPRSGFVSNFIDTAFNGCLFMWDSVFILMFGRYGARAFDFQKTLDNLYSHQHPDGFICREIDQKTGEDRFERFDPASTGPHVMPWSEWEYFLNSGDRERLRAVFPPLLAFTQWMHKHRRWPDGGYWLSGWGCGMDNIPRLQPGYHVNFDHGQMVWIDATLQQILANRHLIAMAQVLGRQSEVSALQAEADALVRYVNAQLWDETRRIYTDRWDDGRLNGIKSIAAFWALLADAAPADRVRHLVAHLRNPAEFNRPHRVPSLSADHPEYQPGGDYWRGSIWPPTNYMVLRGLTSVHEDALAHEIALNHVDNVTRVFQDTGTLWENYAPETPARGSLSGRDFVGWAGVPPIAVLLEYVFGLRPDASEKRLLWDVRLLDSHGVKRYPFGADGSLDLFCAGRKNEDEEPRIEAASTMPVKLVVQWKAGEKEIQLAQQ